MAMAAYRTIERGAIIDKQKDEGQADWECARVSLRYVCRSTIAAWEQAMVYGEIKIAAQAN